MRPIVVVLAITVAVVAGYPRTTIANGRFPQAQRLLEHPGDPSRLYLTATYGLLVTEDRGRNWYYLCELAFALKFVEGDPLLEIMSDGRLLGGIFETENLSDDCGCTWKTVLAQSPTEIVTDIARDKNGALIATVRNDATAISQVALYESTDSGSNWRKVSDLPVEISDAFTVDVAPSDTSRVYVSAFIRDLAIGVLLVSKDRGISWERLDVPGTSGAAQPFIAAVYPTDPDRIFLRIDSWDDTLEFAAQDGLLYSNDGGKTWTEVLHRQAKLFGFALSPDGSTVLAGYGDPIQSGGRMSNIDDNGIYKASTQDFTFEKIFSATVSCLRWTATGVYVCAVQYPGGMTLGFRSDADFTIAIPNPFATLLDLKNVRGPPGCLASACSETWTRGTQGTAPVCDVLGADCKADLSANSLACMAGPGSGGSSGGGPGTGSGGTGGADAGTGAKGQSAGCGCRQTYDPPTLLEAGIVLFVVMWVQATTRDLTPLHHRAPPPSARTSRDRLAGASWARVTRRVGRDSRRIRRLPGENAAD